MMIVGTHVVYKSAEQLDEQQEGSQADQHDGQGHWIGFRVLKCQSGVLQDVVRCCHQFPLSVCPLRPLLLSLSLPLAFLPSALLEVREYILDMQLGWVGMVLILIGNVYILVANPLSQRNFVLIIEVPLAIVLDIGERIAYPQSLRSQATADQTLLYVIPQTNLRTHHLYPSEVFVPHRSDVQFTRRRAFYLINQRAFSHGKKVGMSVSGCWSGVGSFYLVMGRIGVVLLGCLKRKRRVYRTYIRCVYGIFDDRRHVCNRRLVQRHIQGQRNPGTALLDRRLIALLISEGDLASTPPPFQSHPAAGVYFHQTAILDHRNAIQKPHLSLPKRKRRYCCLFGSEVMGAGVLGVGEQVVGTSVMVQSSFLLCRHCWSGEVAAVENFVPTRTT